jgi:transcriptional regulator with XRE-family HTH domain
MSVNQNTEIGRKLKDYFKSLKLTQQTIADRLGMSQSAVNTMMNGKSFGKKQAKKWGEAFGIKPNWLLTGEGEMLKESEYPDIQSNKVEEPEDHYEVNQDKSNNIKQLIATNRSLSKTVENQSEVLRKMQEKIIKLEIEIDELKL